MKKVCYGAFVAVLLLMCLCLSVGLVVFGPAQAGANEQLSDLPAIKTEDGWNQEYLSQLMGYVNDRFFLRQELISLEHKLWSFADKEESGVLLGKDGWLFFADTLADYTDTAPMTQRELFSAQRNLELMAQYCAENGKQFAFMIAPNKNSLYGQFMENYGVQADSSDAQRLMQRLEKAGVPTVDMLSVFSQEEEILYFAHDSHWNSKGAALGADLINSAFGVESDYYGGDFSQSQPHDGDLYAMLYPALTDPETDPVYGGQLNFTFTGKATRPDAIVLTTEGQGSGNLLAYRDSFGMLLFPYLADSYAQAKFSRSNTYDLTGDASHVLVELVERNLSYLYENLPILPAPVRQAALPEEAAGKLTVETQNRSGLTQITGQLPAVDADSPIYAVSNGTVYEAFCLAEGGFGLSLPQDAQVQAVLCTVDGNMTMYTVDIK